MLAKKTAIMTKVQMARVMKVCLFFSDSDIAGGCCSCSRLSGRSFYLMDDLFKLDGHTLSSPSFSVAHPLAPVSVLSYSGLLRFPSLVGLRGPLLFSSVGELPSILAVLLLLMRR